LYHLVLGWDVVSSIEALVNANYVADALDSWCRRILLEALTTQDGGTDAAVDVLKKEDESWDKGRAIDALDELRNALITVK
jgi:hypothetical protein